MVYVTCQCSYVRNDNTAQKMKLFIKDLFRKCDQIRSFLRIWSHLLKKSFMKASFFVECKNLQEVNATCKFIWNVCCWFIYGVSFYQGKLGLTNLMKSYLRCPLFRMSPIRIFVCYMFIKTMGILHGFHFADVISPNVSRILWKSSS